MLRKYLKVVVTIGLSTIMSGYVTTALFSESASDGIVLDESHSETENNSSEETYEIPVDSSLTAWIGFNGTVKEVPLNRYSTRNYTPYIKLVGVNGVVYETSIDNVVVKIENSRKTEDVPSKIIADISFGGGSGQINVDYVDFSYRGDFCTFKATDGTKYKVSTQNILVRESIK